MYKNLKVERLVELIENWKKNSEKMIKRYEVLKMDTEYWKGQKAMANSVLQVFEIYK